MTGWIKIDRAIAEHWIWQDAEKLKWWLDLLLLAAWEDKEMLYHSNIFTLKRGQVVASVSYLMDRWNKSKTTVIRYLQMLESADMISRETRYPSLAIITICNYESYQASVDTCVDTQMDTCVDTNKEIEEEEKNKKEKLFTKVNSKKKEKKSFSPSTRAPTLEEKRKKFYDSLIPYVGQYGKETVRDFYEYWTEPYQRIKDKMRYEGQQTWDVSRRLRTWKERENQINTHGNYRNNISRDEERRQQQQERIQRSIQYLANEAAERAREGIDLPY